MNKVSCDLILFPWLPYEIFRVVDLDVSPPSFLFTAHHPETCLRACAEENFHFLFQEFLTNFINFQTTMLILRCNHYDLLLSLLKYILTRFRVCIGREELVAVLVGLDIVVLTKCCCLLLTLKYKGHFLLL